MLRLIFGPGWDASTESCSVCPASFGDVAAEATIARRRIDARSRDGAAFADRALRQEAGTNEERMCGSPERVISRLHAKRSCGDSYATPRRGQVIPITIAIVYELEHGMTNTAEFIPL